MNAIQFAGGWKVPASFTAGVPDLLYWPVALVVGLVNWVLWMADVVVSLPSMVYSAFGTVAGGKCQENPLLVPTFTATMRALYDAMISGELLSKGLNSVRLLLQGYATGLFLATILTTLAILTTIGNDFLETLTAMLNPLPAIALLPLALIWFGLGDKSIIFVLVHSVLWAVALNTHSGFKSVSNTLRMVGRNYGLTGIAYVRKILIPAAFPSILTGLKIGWAFAWRTLIAAELVFGASSGKGGLGWFIYESKNQLEIPSVFAGLFTVILIGLLVENLIFRNLEAVTVRRWGMQN
ncbi:MAG: ABC transporter permease [Steroidobacteraceae bacterium]